MNRIIRLELVFKYRVWGGTRLKQYFNCDIPTDKAGEAWAISAHKNGDCQSITKK
ncbi:hypothetical protein [Clostridium magnum]|uniref:Putative mannose-6-phosphate isomerase GmuF n=1 Tax=Clostridium magnum DSM 2767 TaxID=1121326 RepID=A0A162SM28_9CLOT|nr:hypothetical protein [Clostridium magnum]KZL91597.1 putative mannose-6-phosphate isomerase GmuF [Clostridium magnum DSM 2767]SHH48979.1 mannose-6-phosphate isomerase [Clostridium magnum DSM 2767]